MRHVFASADYRRLWAARTVSQWGDTFNFVALALLIYDLTGSGLGVTGVVVAEILPVLLLAPVAGPLVDRWPRVRVMVGSDLFRMALMVVLAFWHDAAAGVYAIAFAMSVGAVFFNPAASSVLPAIASKDALVAANSGIWTAAVLSQVMLAPLAGLLVVTVGYGPAFTINAVSYALSALVLRRLHVTGPAEGIQRRRLVAEARDGVTVLLRHRMLRALAVGQLRAALSAGATSALLVVLAKDHLGVTGSGFGLLIAAIGIGAALGPLAMLRLIHNPARPNVRIRPLRPPGGRRHRPRRRHRHTRRSRVTGRLRCRHLHRSSDLQLDAPSRNPRARQRPGLRLHGRALAVRQAHLPRHARARSRSEVTYTRSSR